MPQTRLPNNCHIGTISVSPKDWKRKGASMKPWEISYRFYDPAHDKPHQVKLRGMNHLTSLEERRRETKKILEAEVMLLKEGYNPRLGKYVRDSLAHDLNPYTPFLSALEYARNELKVVPATKVNIKSQLGFLKTAAIQLNYHTLGISEIKRRHVKFLLNKVDENNPTGNNSRYNKFRTNLKILFSYLLELDIDIVDENPVNDIKRKEEETKVKKVLTREQRRIVDLHLKKKGQNSFRLYNRIFFHHSIRSTELLKVQGKDVDLKGQWLTVTILKRTKPERVRKTIKTIAIRYWKLALRNCGPDDYVFSDDFKPGPEKKGEAMVNRRWKRHVKDEPIKNKKGKVVGGGLGIDVDHYAFKHGNTTEIIDDYGFAVAAANASHTSETMVRKLYDVKRDEREHSKIKDVKNAF